MPFVDKSVIAYHLSPNCFPLKTDSLTSEFGNRSLTIANLNDDFLKSAFTGARTACNRDFLILSVLINTHEEGSLEYNWAIAHLLILLTSVRDNRLGLMEILTDHWSKCVRNSDENENYNEDINRSMEEFGLGKETLAAVEKKVEAIRRNKNHWYPRARHQINSREYLKAVFFPNANAENHLDRDTKFIVMGTCFARNIGDFMKDLGLPVAQIEAEEEITADEHFSKCTENKEVMSYINQAKNACFILTLGFAELRSLGVGSAARSGGLSKFDNPDDISDVVVKGVRNIKEINPKARIFITLSPVPLQGTASEFNVFEANAISKAIVRYAIALAVKKDSSIEYFPSYEIVTQIAAAVGDGCFANDDGHPRHVNKNIVSLICSLFIETYCPWALKRVT